MPDYRCPVCGIFEGQTHGDHCPGYYLSEYLGVRETYNILVSINADARWKYKDKTYRILSWDPTVYCQSDDGIWCPGIRYGIDDGKPIGIYFIRNMVEFFRKFQPV